MLAHIRAWMKLANKLQINQWKTEVKASCIFKKNYYHILHVRAGYLLYGNQYIVSYSVNGTGKSGCPYNMLIRYFRLPSSYQAMDSVLKPFLAQPWKIQWFVGLICITRLRKENISFLIAQAIAFLATKYSQVG